MLSIQGYFQAFMSLFLAIAFMPAVTIAAPVCASGFQFDTIQSISTILPNTGATYLLSRDGKVYESTSMQICIIGSGIVELGVNSENGPGMPGNNRLHMLGNDHKVYVRNGNNNWQVTGSGIVDIAMDPNNQLYALGTDQFLYKKKTTITGWTIARSGVVQIESGPGSRLFVRSYDQKVHYYEEGTDTWIEIGSGISQIALTGGGQILALDRDGDVFVWGGFIWTQIASNVVQLANDDVVSSSGLRFYRDVYKLATNRLIHRYDDAAASWGSHVGSGIVQLANDGRRNLIALGQDNVVFKRNSINTPWSVIGSGIVQLANDSRNRLFALGNDRIVYGRTNDGLTWNVVGSGIIELAIDSRENVYALGQDDNLFQRELYGTTWDQVFSNIVDIANDEYNELFALDGNGVTYRRRFDLTGWDQEATDIFNNT